MPGLAPRTLLTRSLVRSLSTSHYVGATNAYKPLPQAKHFPIRTDTMLPPGSYKDRVVLVTGGGTGLGKGMATKFAELGAKVRQHQLMLYTTFIVFTQGCYLQQEVECP